MDMASKVDNFVLWGVREKISLSRDMVPNDSDNNSSLRVSLHHLKELKLAGYLQNVFRCGWSGREISKVEVEGREGSSS